MTKPEDDPRQADMYYLSERDALVLAEQIAKMDPRADQDDNGTFTCFFCNAKNPPPGDNPTEQHAKDCAWMRARRIEGEPV